MRDMEYARRLTPDPQDLTLEIASLSTSRVMDRLDALNELYTPLQFLTDLTTLTFAEAQASKKVTPYRMAVQKSMVWTLGRALNNGKNVIRPAVLRTLQQIQQKAKSASATAPDAESRAHWANLNDEIGRLLTWK